MSFLDNLEDHVKNAEAREEGQNDAERQRRIRQNERAMALASAGFADELKNGAYAREVLKQAARIGHQKRLKVYVAWLGQVLRLEARARRLEFRPTPQGVTAVHIEAGSEIRSEPVDLNGNPEELLKRWLAAA